MFPELEKMHRQFKHDRFPYMQFFRMCEAAQGGPLDGRHLVCPEDATCLKCIEKVAPYKLVRSRAAGLHSSSSTSIF